MSQRMTGAIKWFNDQKGFGFIAPDQGGKDVFVHASAFERSGMPLPREGQRFEFELEMNKGREAASKLKDVA